jgi:hypothetical protein
MSESYGRRGYAERGYAKTGRGYAKTGRGYTEPGYTEPGYTADGQESTRAGGIMLAAISVLSSLLVILGLYYATGTTERHKAAMAAAGCEPNLMSINVGCTTVKMLVSQYTSITNPAIQQLNADVVAYTAAESHSLAAAETAVSAEVATADGLAQGLAQIPFPPFATHEATVTIQAIEARVKLLSEQARSSSLAQLRSFNGRVDAAGTALQADMKLLNTAVRHHPTASQEPSGND